MSEASTMNDSLDGLPQSQSLFAYFGGISSLEKAQITFETALVYDWWHYETIFET